MMMMMMMRKCDLTQCGADVMDWLAAKFQPIHLQHLVWPISVFEYSNIYLYIIFYCHYSPLGGRLTLPFVNKNDITDACSTADCCPLLIYCPDMPQMNPHIPQMMPQTCPRWCPRHAQMMSQICARWCPTHAPDVGPDMPQTYLSISYLISSKRLLFKKK